MSEPGRPDPMVALRLRPLQPLVDRDGTSTVAYDQERDLLVAVPLECRGHAARSLDSGDLDDDLVAWLAGEDLLTWDDPAGPVASAAWWSASPPGGELGSVWYGEDAVHCHPVAGGERAALTALETQLVRTDRGPRLVLHLAAAADPAELRRVAREARRIGRDTGRAVALELTTDGRGITEALLRSLAGHDLAVRLTAERRRVIDLVLRHLPDRLTLCARLDTGDRLADLWHRAAALGLRRLHAVKVTDRPAAGPFAVPEAELRDYRRDLFAVADDHFAALAAERAPRLLYEPLAAIVRRHLSGRAAAVGPGGSAGYLGVVGPRLASPLLGPAPAWGASGGDEPVERPCARCWARRLCPRGLDAVAGRLPFPVLPRGDRCDFWRAEVEVGLLLYHRLERAAGASFLPLGDGGDAPFFDAFAPPRLGGHAVC